MNFASTLTCFALVGLFALPADAQENQADRRVPLDVSLSGIESASSQGWGTTQPPFRCIEAIVDQKGGPCLQASSVPTPGMLFAFLGSRGPFAAGAQADCLCPDSRCKSSPSVGLAAQDQKKGLTRVWHRMSTS